MALTVIITGLLSILMQTLLLRKLLTLFSGNELHLGISLSLWLFFSSIGAGPSRGLMVLYIKPLRKLSTLLNPLQRNTVFL